MGGGARAAVRCRISKFTIENCAAGQAMIQRKTSLRFVQHAIQTCIAELIEDLFLIGRGGQKRRGYKG
jgi:hypothetical protein